MRLFWMSLAVAVFVSGCGDAPKPVQSAPPAAPAPAAPTAVDIRTIQPLPAPDLKVTDKVEDLAAAVKGTGAKVVFVHVWNSAMPNLVQSSIKLGKVAANLFKGKTDVAAVGVSLDGVGIKDVNQLDTIQRATQSSMGLLNYNAVVLWTGEAAALETAIGIEGVPYFVIVAPDMKVLKEMHIDLAANAPEIEAVVKKELEESLKEVK